MRVITGSLRGRRLLTLEGNDVRPTTDKVKEAIFSIIQFDVPSAIVLDLFAGSGQLGIEALSRGAKRCVFVDRAREAVQIVKKNIDSCRISDAARVYNCDSIDYLRGAPGGFDIAFVDPPYEQGLVVKALELLKDKMSQRGIIVCEHEGGLELPDRIGRIKVRRRYSYGKKIALTVYEVDSKEDVK